jgi:hypothetical protein
MDLQERVRRGRVASGTWLYDGTASLPVWVVALDYDYWFALGAADDLLEPGEEPTPLGPDGLLYYPSFRSIDGPGYPTIVQAKADAQARLTVPINWRD